MASGRGGYTGMAHEAGECVWSKPQPGRLGFLGACTLISAFHGRGFLGQPTWGTWWIWDARLNRMLILFVFVWWGFFKSLLTRAING